MVGTVTACWEFWWVLWGVVGVCEGVCVYVCCERDGIEGYDTG